MSLPIYQSQVPELLLLQTQWTSQLNPLLANPLVNGILLKNVSLANGVTTVNHLLGRKMQGWFITDINGAASVYRSQPFNSLTLTLTSSAQVTVSLYVF